MEQQHIGGRTVVFVNRGVRVNALVAQSEVTNILDNTQESGIRQEEHLTLVYLKPELLQNRMGGADLDRAIGKDFGVLALTEAPADPENKLKYALKGSTDEHSVYDPNLVVSVADNPHPELVQYPPLHAPQSPALQSRFPAGKIPAESSYRVTEQGPDEAPCEDAEEQPAEHHEGAPA